MIWTRTPSLSSTTVEQIYSLTTYTSITDTKQRSDDNSWSFLPSRGGPSSRTLVTPIPVNNNNGFLVFGGFKGAFYPPDGSYYGNDYDWYNDLWYYDLSGETWTQLQQNGNNAGPPVLCWYAAVPATSSANNDGEYSTSLKTTINI